jgi:glycosyltransferase involved in cell wall biosynthesis
MYVYHLTGFGIGGLLAAKCLGIPVVLHLLGNDLDVYLNHRRFRCLLMPALRRFDRLSVQGSASRAVAEKLGLNGVFEFPTACNLPERTATHGLRERDIDLIFVGRIAQEKRLDRFLEIVRLLTEAPSSWPPKVVVVGDGPLRAEIETRAAKLKDRCRIEGVGWQRDVHAWLRRTKVFLLTSDRDQLPLSLLEAMSVGTVPAVTRVGNLADVVDDRTGLCFDRLETPKAAAWIASILKDEGVWTEKSKACIQRAREYSVPQVAGRLRAVLEAVMK